jgi:hypothetical protein
MIKLGFCDKCLVSWFIYCVKINTRRLLNCGYKVTELDITTAHQMVIQPHPADESATPDNAATSNELSCHEKRSDLGHRQRGNPLPRLQQRAAQAGHVVEACPAASSENCGA